MGSDVYAIVAERSGGVCERCRERPAQQMHHRCSRQAGGSKHTRWINLPSNVVHLCGTSADGCHGWATTRPLEARASGWVVPRGVAEQQGTAAVVPLTDLQGASFFLLDAGTVVPIVLLHPEGTTA